MMRKIFRSILLSIFLFFNVFAVSAHAERFPDPIKYVSDGVVWGTKAFPKSKLIEKLGQPLRTTDACVVQLLKYPHLDFYEDEDNSVYIHAIRFDHATDKVIFKKFVVDQNTSELFVKKFNPELLENEDGVQEYMIRIPGTKNYDDYAYIFYFKEHKLVEFSTWEQVC